MAKTKKPKLLSRLKLGELSFVDVPANRGARIGIYKRGEATPPTPSEIAQRFISFVQKYGEEPGARTFSEVLDEREEEQRRWRAQEELYPLFSALQTSLHSIAADKSLSSGDKSKKIQASCDDFMTAVKEKMPDVEEELAKALESNPAVARFINPQHEEEDMSAELQKKVDELTAELGTVKKSAEDAAAKMTILEAEKTELAKKLEDAEKQIDVTKNDETIKIGESIIKKSEVGAGVFAAMKAQQEEIAKRDEALELATLEKRAETEIGHLPGESVMKARVLRAIGKMDEDTRKVVLEMLKAGDAAQKTLTKSIGGNPPPGGDTAQAKFDELVTKRAADDKVSVAEATTRVMKTAEGSRLYAEAKQERFSRQSAA